MSKLRIFHVVIPNLVHSRAFRCIWLLEELGVSDFEVCLLDPKGSYQQQMNARGAHHSLKIPTLLMDGNEIGESSVITQLLAEKFQPQRNLLGEPDERIKLMQWVALAETSVTFRLPLVKKLMTFEDNMDTLKSDIINPMENVFENNIAYFEAHFEQQKSDFLLKSGFSIADTMCGWSLYTFHQWGLMDLSSGQSPRTFSYLKRLMQRPAFITTLNFADLTPGLYGPGGQLVEHH